MDFSEEKQQLESGKETSGVLFIVKVLKTKQSEQRRDCIQEGKKYQTLTGLGERKRRESAKREERREKERSASGKSLNTFHLSE